MTTHKHTVQLSTSLTEVTSTSSTELQTLPSSTMLGTTILDTLVLNTSILDSSSTSTSISTLSLVSTFVASPVMSTIVSIPSKKEISARIVETKPQLRTIFLRKGKEKVEDVDLDEEIVIPNWDISRLTPNQMHSFGELL